MVALFLKPDKTSSASVFGDIEFQTDMKVVDIKAGLHNMTALTSEYTCTVIFCV